MDKNHRNVGSYTGTKGSQTSGGVFTNKTQQVLATNLEWNTLVTNGLILHLDAANTASYPGTGTVWYDLSPSGYNYNLASALAYQSTGPKYMDLGGTFGGAASVNTSNPASPAEFTMMVWTRIKTYGDWRTLTRPYVNDHSVIIDYLGWDIGLYDNDSAGFLRSGFSQQNLPNFDSTAWVCLYFRIKNTAPQWRMSYNDTPEVIRGSITNAAAWPAAMLGNLSGCCSSTPSGLSQYWGDIAAFYMYNRTLTDAELLQNFKATRSRYGI
jgi:hypothetical protein